MDQARGSRSALVTGHAGLIASAVQMQDESVLVGLGLRAASRAAWIRAWVQPSQFPHPWTPIGSMVVVISDISLRSDEAVSARMRI
jgi:hypothetical protein